MATASLASCNYCLRLQRSGTVSGEREAARGQECQRYRGCYYWFFHEIPQMF